VLTTRPFVICVSEPDFVRWLQTGLLDPACRVLAQPGADDIVAELPPKYHRLRDAGQQCPILLDEVIALSKLTSEQTSEWGAKLRNLGEGWLPIRFVPFEIHPPVPLSEFTAESQPAAPLMADPQSPDGGDSVPAPDNSVETAEMLRREKTGPQGSEKPTARIGTKKSKGTSGIAQTAPKSKEKPATANTKQTAKSPDTTHESSGAQSSLFVDHETSEQQPGQEGS